MAFKLIIKTSYPSAVATILLLLLFVNSAESAGKRDPGTGRIKVLYVGEPTGLSPYPMFEADPLILPYPVKASTVVFSFEIARRSMRQYMPRTYNDLSSYQVFILSDANAGVFTASQLKWYTDAVRDKGSGLVMIGGNEAFGGRGGQTSWGTTSVEQVLPVESLNDQWIDGTVEIIEPDHPFIASLPIGPGLDWMRKYDGNKVRLKTGALELAKMVPMTTESVPFWATWRIEEGRTFAIAGDWTPAGGVVFMRWEYYGDFAVNLMLYLSDNDLPDDLETMHQARSQFLEYRSDKAYLLNIMEFGEKFGANMIPVGEIIGEADAIHKEAMQAYLDLNLQKSLELLDKSLGTLSDGVEKAINLKDQAMVWIFVIEWTAVTGTFSICGFVLWTLMVRRRLYKEIASTRFE